MIKHSFFALISRMKNISRWSLMRNNSIENIQEHSHMVAVIAHALAIIKRDVFGENIDPGLAASIALYHDSSEIFTGDMPTPIKYYDPEIMEAYKKVENVASEKLLKALPIEFRESYATYIKPNKDDYVYSLVKAADTMGAYIKCIEEQKSGNPEFSHAKEQSLRKLESLKMPEVDYFIKHFIPAFELSLDELDFSMD
ncbi:MAG: 5'-deoxynucleotidase [Oscillospiraceae bacterium]|jgi:5'-deoxynucleotidase|nr:5'-deoxynucleotidase [Oscillospiraceae bacterium]